MPTIDLVAPLEILADQLRAAGIPASIDTAHVNPPAAWVHADEITFDRFDGNATISVVVDLIVPDAGTPVALTQLQQLLGLVLDVIEPDGPIETDRAVQLRNGQQLPAFRIPVNLDLT